MYKTQSPKTYIYLQNLILSFTADFRNFYKEGNLEVFGIFLERENLEGVILKEFDYPLPCYVHIVHQLYYPLDTHNVA